MAENEVRLIIQSEEKIYPAGTTYLQIAKEYQKDDADDIILVLINNRLRELGKVANVDGELVFITTAGKTGRRTYRRSVILLMQKAIHNLWGERNIDVRVKYSIGQGYYCELVEKTDLTEKAVVYLEDAVQLIKEEMDRLVKADIPLTKESWKTEKAVQLFHEQGMYDKARLFRYRRSSRVNIYNLDGYRDYFYGYMAPSTGCLKYYDIIKEAEGFMLLFPGENTKQVAEYEPRQKLFNTLKSSRDWGKMLDIDSIGALNDTIAQGNTQSMILTQEALFEERIGNLAQQIVETGGRKFIMIAGPSSSGKTGRWCFR